MKIKRYFTTTVSITLLLLLGGVASYLMLGAREKAVQLRSEFITSIFLQDTITLQDQLQIQSNLQTNNSVQSVIYISSEQAAADFVQQIGTDFRTLFDTNPLPASFQVTLKNDANVRQFERQATTYKGVEEVTYPYQLATQVDKGLTQLSYFVIGFAVILGFVLVIMLNNTVRMDVAASADEVTRALKYRTPINLIRNPFILRAYSQGAIAGALASVFLFLATDGIALTFPIAQLPISLPLLGVIFAAMILAGMLLTTLFTYFAVESQIRNNFR